MFLTYKPGFVGCFSIPEKFFQVLVGQEIILAESERITRNDLKIAVQEFLIALCLEAAGSDEKLPAAAGRAVPGCHADFVIA